LKRKREKLFKAKTRKVIVDAGKMAMVTQGGTRI
jgi:hypothetical protein